MSTYNVQSATESIDSQLEKFSTWIFHTKYRRMISLVLLTYLSLYMYILLKNNMTILVAPITVLLAVFLITLTDCRITVEVLRDPSPEVPVEVDGDDEGDEGEGQLEAEDHDEEEQEESKESEGSDQPGFPVEQPVAEHSAAELPPATPPSAEQQPVAEQPVAEQPATEWTTQRLTEMD